MEKLIVDGVEYDTRFCKDLVSDLINRRMKAVMSADFGMAVLLSHTICIVNQYIKELEKK